MNGKFGFPTIWGDNKVDVVSTATAIEEGLFELECKKDLLWVMTRYLSSYLEQGLPGLAGFWSVLGDEPPRLKIIDYYPVINLECSNHNDTILKLFRLIPNDWVCFHAYA
jgi:hypothetical protein